MGKIIKDKTSTTKRGERKQVKSLMFLRGLEEPSTKSPQNKHPTIVQLHVTLRDLEELATRSPHNNNIQPSLPEPPPPFITVF